MNVPCSMLRTPARIAILIPSAAWACAMTGTRWRAASSTAILISSMLKWTSPGLSPTDMKAPVTRSLIQSLPYLISWRTALRISSTPSTTSPSAIGCCSGAMKFMSPPPPVIEM